MTQPERLSAELARYRPRAATLVRHGIDGASAPITYLVANALWGARWGAVAALVAALVVGSIRRYRGERLLTVTIAIGLVGLYSASAIMVGDGRAFFFPEIMLNVTGLVICLVGVAARRPVTLDVHRRITGKVDREDPRMRRFHHRLTLAWAVLFLSHVLPMTWLFVIDSVAGLAAVSAFFDKPTIVAMGVLSVVLTRRAAARLDLDTVDVGAAPVVTQKGTS